MFFAPPSCWMFVNVINWEQTPPAGVLSTGEIRCWLSLPTSHILILVVLTDDRQTSSLLCLPVYISLTLPLRSPLKKSPYKGGGGCFCLHDSSTFYCCRNLLQIFLRNHILMGRLTINLNVILKMLRSRPQSLLSSIIILSFFLISGISNQLKSRWWPSSSCFPCEICFYQHFQERSLKPRQSELRHRSL